MLRKLYIGLYNFSECSKGSLSISSASSSSDTSPVFLSPPPLDTSNDDSSSTKSMPLTETSEESPISVASSSPDCVIADEYSSDSSPRNSETSSSSGVDTGGKTASSFCVPEPPEDVSVLFMDETDYEESSSVEQSVVKQPCTVKRRNMAVFTDPHSSPTLKSPADVSSGEEGSPSPGTSEESPTLSYQVGSGEEEERDGRSTSRISIKSDNSPSLSSKASPTLSYHVSSGEGEEEQGEGSPPLSSVKPDNSPSLSSEASPTLSYHVSSGEEEERDEGNTSPSSIRSDCSPSLSNEASPSLPSSEAGRGNEGRSTSLIKVSVEVLSSDGGEEDKKDGRKSSPVHKLSQSSHSPETSGASGPENGTCSGGSGGSASGGGIAGGNSSEVKIVRVEQEQEEEGSAKPEPQFKVGHQYRTVQRQLMQNEVNYN